MKNILITGAGGRLGSKVAEHLAGLGFSLTLLTSKLPENRLINSEYILVNWDNLDIPPLKNIDVVIHLAHQTSSYEARKNVERDIQSNLIATVRIIESLRNSVKPPHFIYMGSLTEYGSDNINPINEINQQVQPETFYDCSKLATELYLKQFQNEGRLKNLTLIRLGNLYGFVEGFKKRHRGFFDEAIFSAFKGEKVVCFGDGGFVRDFVHVNDVLNALVGFIEAPGFKSNGLFNLASGQGTTLKAALKSIDTLLLASGQTPMEIEFRDFPDDAYRIERRNHIADISRIKEAIEWSPEISLSEGIALSIHYYLNQFNATN
jgi:UDP-glucose 4-epimerase